jgi:hypothetical protein
MSDIPRPPAVASAAPVRPAGRPTYVRTQSAPFVFGLAVGAIWFWQRYAVALALDPTTHSFSAMSARQAMGIALAVVAAFFVWPAATAVGSTIGDARFWGASGPARARAGLRLSLACVLAFALGSAWLLDVFPAYAQTPGTAVLILAYRIAPYPVPPFAPLVSGFAFLIGLLAAFTFARWPLPAARFPLLTQVAR